MPKYLSGNSETGHEKNSHSRLDLILITMNWHKLTFAQVATQTGGSLRGIEEDFHHLQVFILGSEEHDEIICIEGCSL
jgi:hypothetical protein